MQRSAARRKPISIALQWVMRTPMEGNQPLVVETSILVDQVKLLTFISLTALTNS
jgi:hypothetical protein